MDSHVPSNTIQDLAAQAERVRERARTRARERREAMTAEQREAYLAQRREYYHSRRARLTNNRRTSNQSTRAQLQMDLGPQFPTSPGARGRLARSIPVPINLNSSSTHLPQTSNSSTSSSTATSTGAHVNSIARVSSGRLSRSIPMPMYVNSIPNNQAEASTSTPTFTQPAETAATITCVTRFSGRSHVTPLPHNPFTFNNHLNHHFETSTSRGNTSTREGVQRDEIDIRMSDAEDVNSESSNDDDRTSRTNLHHNRARDFREEHGFPPFKLPNPTTCHLCCARLFHGENKNFCCKGGRVILPEIPVPVELLRIFTDTSAEGRIFRQNIRPYNHVFSFTSMGVQLDERVSTGPGVYAFRAHGAIYHKIGSLLPHSGTRPRYLQMFIYDTEHETDNRMLESTGLNRELLEKIKRILDEHNPFVKTFRQLAQRPDIHHCKLLIKERPTSDRQYTLPTASQVAAVISGDESLGDANNRNIVVQTIGGQLRHIKEFSGYYDPLQYPLFLPLGTYGWDSDTRTIRNVRVTCCDYYAYMLQIRINNPSILLYGGRLLQQYVVDNFVKIETQKLRYIRSHQDKIRAELYQGLQDCLEAGENDADL